MSDAFSKQRNLLAQEWYDPRFPPHALTYANVLGYFGHPDSNPFYDRDCLNERQKQENIDPERLKNYEGIEYTVSHAQDPVLQVIRKQWTQRGRAPKPLAYYYVARGNAFQAPDASSVVSSRLASCMFHLRKALSIARTHVEESQDQPQPRRGGDTEHDGKYRSLPPDRSKANTTSEHVLAAHNWAAIQGLEATLVPQQAPPRKRQHSKQQQQGTQADKRQQQEGAKRKTHDEGDAPAKKSKPQ